MSPWKQVALLAKREFKERATSKPFLITMSILVLLILAVGPAVNLFVSDETEATRIGLVGEEPADIESALEEFFLSRLERSWEEGIERELQGR